MACMSRLTSRAIPDPSPRCSWRPRSSTAGPRPRKPGRPPALPDAPRRPHRAMTTEPADPSGGDPAGSIQINSILARLGLVVHLRDGCGGRWLELRHRGLGGVAAAVPVLASPGRDVRRRARGEVELLFHSAQALLELDDSLAQGPANLRQTLAEEEH